MLNEKGYVFGEFFSEMGGSIGGIIKTAITRPIYTLKFILKIQPPLFNKPLFLVQLFFRCYLHPSFHLSASYNDSAVISLSCVE